MSTPIDESNWCLVIVCLIIVKKLLLIQQVVHFNFTTIKTIVIMIVAYQLIRC